MFETDFSLSQTFLNPKRPACSETVFPPIDSIFTCNIHDDRKRRPKKSSDLYFNFFKSNFLKKYLKNLGQDGPNLSYKSGHEIK